jgi:hypothetical protein
MRTDATPIQLRSAGGDAGGPEACLTADDPLNVARR